MIVGLKMSEYQKTAQVRNRDSLEIEKTMLVKAIKECCDFGLGGIKGDGTNRKKNKTDSIYYRQLGNMFFKSGYHSSDVHGQILKLYTQSVALAPNESQELSDAYGNRSALLFHLKKFGECIKDCDLALSVCKSDASKARFLCRKVQCLSSLKDSSIEKAYEEVLHLIDQLHLDTSTKEKYVEILKNSKVENVNSETNENQSVKEELPIFTHQKEAPCASEAVAIQYNEKWGRHIVATRSIDPGEIIALEKSYCSIVYPENMWFYCQNCVKFTWSSIPCEHCIYGIYCSQECRQEAWEKFHKFECAVFPYIWDIDEDLKGNTSSIRLLLLAVNEVGGINELRKEILDVENTQDSLKKGFSKDGIFHSDKFRSIFSLSNVRDLWDPEDRDISPLYIVAPLYYLATCTTLFGTKLTEGVHPEELLSLDDALFFGALITRLIFVVPCNFIGFLVGYQDFELASLGFVATSFCCLFNHSCNPNTVLVKSENNELIAYVDRPVQKGEQLFIAYMNNNYHFVPKQERQQRLLQAYYFKCECIACLNDWTMPSKQDLQNPEAIFEVGKEASKFTNILNENFMKDVTKYEPKLIKKLAEMLKMYDEILTPNDAVYLHFSKHLFRLFHRSFGSWYTIPDTC